MKKVLALLLAVLLLLALAACGEGAGEAQKEETASADENAYRGELPFVNPGDAPVTITIGLVSNANVTDYKDNAYTKWLEEQTGLNLEFQQFMSAKDAATQVALMTASGEKLPDILWRITAITKQQGEQYGQEGYFVPMTEYFEKYAYYLRKAYDECFDGDPRPLELSMRRAAGADNQPIYCFPNEHHDQWSDAMHQAWINQDWLDKLGLQAPTTVDELYNVLVAFRDGDPNGNGKKDEIPMVGKVSSNYYSAMDPMNYIINAYTYFNNDAHFVAENRTITTPYKSEEYREALKFINKLYKEGLISQLSWTQSASELKGLINPAPGDPYLAGVVFYGSTSIFNQGSDALRAYNPLRPLGDASGRGGCAPMGYARIMTTYISADCAHPVEAFKLLDFLCSSDSYLRQRYGEFGVDWTWAEPGKTGHRGGEAKIKLLNPDVYGTQNAQCWHTVGSVFSETDWQYEVDFSDPDNWDALRAKKLNELYRYSLDVPQPDEVFDFAIYSLADYEERSEFASDLTAYINDRRAEFCTGVLDPANDADWQSYLDGLDALHYDRWIELAQIGYNRIFE